MKQKLRNCWSFFTSTIRTNVTLHLVYCTCTNSHSHTHTSTDLIAHTLCCPAPPLSVSFSVSALLTVFRTALKVTKIVLHFFTHSYDLMSQSGLRPVFCPSAVCSMILLKEFLERNCLLLLSIFSYHLTRKALTAVTHISNVIALHYCVHVFGPFN